MVVSHHVSIDRRSSRVLRGPRCPASCCRRASCRRSSSRSRFGRVRGRALAASAAVLPTRRGCAGRTSRSTSPRASFHNALTRPGRGAPAGSLEARDGSAFRRARIHSGSVESGTNVIASSRGSRLAIARTSPRTNGASWNHQRTCVPVRSYLTTSSDRGRNGWCASARDSDACIARQPCASTSECVSCNGIKPLRLDTQLECSRERDPARSPATSIGLHAHRSG